MQCFIEIKKSFWFWFTGILLGKACKVILHAMHACRVAVSMYIRHHSSIDW